MIFMAIKNYIPPSKDSVYEFYKFIHEFETDISQNPGRYNFDSPEFQKYLNEKNIIIKPVSKSKYIKDLSGNNYIIFVYGDHADPYDDKAHDLLRHLRNSISHGLISKTSSSKRIFDITDRNRFKSLTLRSNIDEDLFFELIRKLKETFK